MPQTDEKKGTMTFVGPPRRPLGENAPKELGKREFSPIFILENNQPKRVMVKILENASKMREKTFLITLTKQLPENDQFKLVEQCKKEMSWSKATVNIYQKLKTK